MLFNNRFVESSVNIFDYLRPNGYVYTRNKGFQSSIKKFALYPCLEVYGDDPDLAKFFHDSYTGLFATSGWYCFNKDNKVVIENDTWISSVGQSTGMSVYYCHWDDPTDENCVTDISVLDKFES